MTFLRQQKTLVALIIASTLLFILTTLLTPDENDLEHRSFQINYGVIVDCGSSGSRAHIFKWSNQTGMIQVNLLKDQLNGRALSKHITPGLSSLKDQPDLASDYMEPIMNFISDSIPSHRHLDTPVQFLATAGLRLLDISTQKKILSDITRDLRIKYDFPRIKSRVITGELEGVYSWISVNRAKLQNYSKGYKSFGMIEMGGASTQATFELSPELEKVILLTLDSKEAIDAFKNEQTELKFGQNNVKLFATTFLGLGVNSARESAVDLLVRDYLNGLEDLNNVQANLKKTEIRLKDPCLTAGSSEIIARPTTLLESKHHAIGSVIKHRVDTFQVRLIGSGNYVQCMNLLDRVLRIVKEEKLNCEPERKSCPMTLLGTEFIPFSHIPFIGLSEMFFTTNEMLNSAGQYNQTKVSSETRRICSTQYNKLLELYSHSEVTHSDRILYECFKASWLLSLLHEPGFRMPNTYHNFMTVDRIDGQEVDWTLGAMISEVANQESLQIK